MSPLGRSLPSPMAFQGREVFLLFAREICLHWGYRFANNSLIRLWNSTSPLFLSCETDLFTLDLPKFALHYPLRLGGRTMNADVNVKLMLPAVPWVKPNCLNPFGVIVSLPSKFMKVWQVSLRAMPLLLDWLTSWCNRWKKKKGEKKRGKLHLRALLKEHS